MELTTKQEMRLHQEVAKIRPGRKPRKRKEKNLRIQITLPESVCRNVLFLAETMSKAAGYKIHAAEIIMQALVRHWGLSR